MEKLFAALKTGSVEEVKRVFKETDVSPTVCNEVQWFGSLVYVTVLVPSAKQFQLKIFVHAAFPVRNLLADNL